VGHNVGVSHRRRQVAVLASQVVSVTPAKDGRDSVSIAFSTFRAKFISGYLQGLLLLLFCEGVLKKILRLRFGPNH
jgi:hypothetical protein